MSGAVSLALERVPLRSGVAVALLLVGLLSAGLGAGAPTPVAPHTPAATSPCPKGVLFCATLILSASQIDAPSTITATAQAKNGSGSYSYQFFWGDGSQNSSSEPTFTHTFLTAPKVEPIVVSVVVTDSSDARTADANATLQVNPALTVSIVPEVPVANITYAPPFWDNFTLLVGNGAPPYYVNVSWGDGSAVTYVEMPEGTTSVVVAHEYRKGASAAYVMEVTVSDTVQGSTSKTLDVTVASAASKGSSPATLLGLPVLVVYGLVAVVGVVVVLVIAVLATRRRRTSRSSAPEDEVAGPSEAPGAEGPGPDVAPPVAVPDLPVARVRASPVTEVVAAPEVDSAPATPPELERYAPPPVPAAGSAAGSIPRGGSNLSRAIFAPPEDRCPICGSELAAPHAPCPLCTPSLVPTPTGPAMTDLPPLPGLEAPASTAPALRPTVVTPKPSPVTSPAPAMDGPWTPPPAFAQTAPPPGPVLPTARPVPDLDRPSAPPTVPRPTPSPSPNWEPPATLSTPPRSVPAPASTVDVTTPPKSHTCLVCGGALLGDGQCPSCGMRWTE